MRPRKLAVLTALIAALLGATITASAAPTPKERADARTAVAEAKKATREKRHGDAVDALRRADGLDPSPAVELDLAQALAASGKLVEAYKLLKTVAASTDKSPASRKARDLATKTLAELGPRVPSIKVTVTGAPASAVTTTIDGSAADLSADYPVDPGEHAVGASVSGFPSASRQVRVAEGTHERVELTLVADAVKPKVAESAGSRTPGIVLASVGGAGLVVGAVFGGLAFSATSTAKGECAGNVCPPSAQSDVDRARLFGDVSTGALIAGGVVAATGIVLAITAPFGKGSDARKDSARVAPWVGPGQAGLAGSF